MPRATPDQRQSISYRGLGVKPLIILLILLSLPLAGDIRSDLKEMSANWFRVGFQCRESSILASTGHGSPSLTVFLNSCEKYRKELGVGEGYK